MPAAASPRIVLTDFDGTFADHGVVPESHIEATRRARANGHTVLLSTGRAICMVPRAVRELFDGAITGAGAVVEIGGERLCDHLVPEDVGRRATEVLLDHGVGFALEASDAIFTTPHTAEVMRARLSDGGRAERNAREILASVQTPDDLTAHRFAKISVWGSPVSMEVLAHEIGPALRPLPNSVATDDSHAGELQLVDVDKADGMRLILEHLGADVSAAIAVGDGMNDLGMLEAAGTAVAIDGGASALLEHADVVVPPPSENGFALALDRLGLL